MGTVDQIAPAGGVRAIRLAAPQAEVYELALRAGHFGLVVGSASNTITWPTVAHWARWRAGEAPAPSGAGPSAAASGSAGASSWPARSRISVGLLVDERRRKDRDDVFFLFVVDALVGLPCAARVVGRATWVCR